MSCTATSCPATSSRRRVVGDELSRTVFETYLDATEKAGKEETVKIALLKVLGGRVIVDEYNLLFGDAPAKTLKEAQEKLASKFKAGESEHYRSHLFWSRGRNKAKKSTTG